MNATIRTYLQIESTLQHSTAIMVLPDRRVLVRHYDGQEISETYEISRWTAAQELHMARSAAAEHPAAWSPIIRMVQS